VTALTAEQISELDRHAGNSRGWRRAACHAPFTTLAFQTSGEVLSCSRKPATVLGNVTRQSLMEIWHGGERAALRAAVSSSSFPAGCAWCDWCAHNGELGLADLRKYRHLELRVWGHKWPRRFEFNLSNVCNLECIHCDGLLSSAIRAREGLPALPRVYGDRFFMQLEEFLPHLDEAVFLGGEPFLQLECFRIWRLLAERKLKTRCVITSNGTVYHAEVARVLDAQPFWLTISLDGTSKATVESVRRNARHAELWQNLERFRRHATKPGNVLVLSFSVMRQNCEEFADFLLLAEELGVGVSLNLVIYPPHCSPSSMPRVELAAVLARLQQREPQLLPRLKRNAAVWRQGLDFLHAALDPGKNSGMVDAIRTVDHSVGRSWRSPLPQA
jgi:MoaA/NifB/PqqE/SkfB family radical SAM enzyme